jgi:hypothetical protein
MRSVEEDPVSEVPLAKQDENLQAMRAGGLAVFCG